MTKPGSTQSKKSCIHNIGAHVSLSQRNADMLSVKIVGLSEILLILILLHDAAAPLKQSTFLVQARSRKPLTRVYMMHACLIHLGMNDAVLFMTDRQTINANQEARSSKSY